MGSADTHGKMDEKLTCENMQKNSSFLCLCYILRAIGAGRCRERRYAEHIFIQIYFRMHHFVVKFSKFSSPQAARGALTPNQNPADVSGKHVLYFSEVARGCSQSQCRNPAWAWSTSCGVIVYCYSGFLGVSVN